MGISEDKLVEAKSVVGTFELAEMTADPTEGEGVSPMNTVGATVGLGSVGAGESYGIAGHPVPE